MNSNCLSTDQLAAAVPVLGLDVAKASVQAELRSSSNKCVLALLTTPRALLSWPASSKSTTCQRFGQAWKPPDPTAMRLHCGSMIRPSR